jgi:hypothetical protein
VSPESAALTYGPRCRRTAFWIKRGNSEDQTGDRRIIDYLLSPLARRIEEAGRERWICVNFRPSAYFAAI